MNDNDPKRLAWAILARYALNTLSVYRLDVYGRTPRSHRAIEAGGKIQAYQGAARVAARTFDIDHAQIEGKLGWALDLMPMQGARRMSETDPGDRFQRIRAMYVRELAEPAS